jgi:hypothetical protein
MFRGPLHLRRLRNNRRHRLASRCRIDRRGPLHIPYAHTQPTSFAPLRETGLKLLSLRGAQKIRKRRCKPRKTELIAALQQPIGSNSYTR